MRKPLYLALVALLGTTGIAAAGPDTVRVRLDHSDLVAAEAVGVTPLSSTDYSGFRVLELSRADADKLLSRSSRAVEIVDAGRIRFNDVSFDPLREGQQSSKGYFPTTADGKGLHLVQFNAPAKQEWRTALENAGLRVLQYYPHDTFLVWGAIDTVAETASQPHVRWQGAFLADYKLNADLAGRTGRIANVDVHFYNDGNVEGLVEQLKNLGAHVLTHAAAQPDKAFYDAWIQVDADKLDAITRMPQVVAVAYASPRGYFDDEMSDQIVAGNYNASNQPQTGYAPWLVTFGYDGTGVIMGVTDSGVDLTHPDLSPRIVGGYTFPGCSSPAGGDDNSSGGHGTHVAGIIAGQGVGDGAGPVPEADANGFKYGLGVAKGAQIYAMATVDCGAPWPPSTGWQELSKRGLAGNAIGTNASWTTGEGANHGYQASERTFDTMIRDGDFDTAGSQPYIIAFSAGNSGPNPSTLTAPKEAKNPIISAASRNFRVGAINDIASFSSRGPARDGRVLPNIASPGEEIASTMRRGGGAACATAIAGTSNYYAMCSGTSMASPHTAGAVAVLTQWWRASHSGANPSPAMAKALLVNGAIDMGTADVPNNNEGWGRINLPRSIGAGVPQHTIDQTVLLDNAGDSHALTFGIPDPTKPVRITLTWTDAPGAVGANPALVNNLDLEVVNAGNTYLGNVMTAGVSTTGGTADAKNNVENVFLPAGANGSVAVTVKATNLPGDGVPGTGDATDQDFALVCDNCSLTPTYTLAAAPPRQEVCAPANATFPITIGSILGYSNAVTLATSGVPAGATANVTPTTVTPGSGTATATLSGTGSLAAGTHTFNVDATSTSGAQTLVLTTDLSTAAPAAATLTAPATGATGTHVLPTLQWNAVPQAKNYLVELATDAAFSNIVFTQTVTATQAIVNTSLAPQTQYFWRVRANNVCGPGTTSAVSTFTTANLVCIAPNLDVPDNTTAGVNSDLVVPYTGTLSDLDVSLRLPHTYPGDLIVTLTHVATNTTVIIGNRPGGTSCGVDNIDVSWNDQSATAMACRATSPGIGGDIRPSNPLAPFNGKALNSTWRLNVADRANQDTGVIAEWCLKPTLVALPDSIFVNGFETPVQ
ncbi:S8 family serine peptidase [Tahibacter soli]|uniref:S8 family serine peptidase n=1 Tax=Tahibacter soli TaxID=2983605 RepID=A0A9X4BJW0_9GAMM|nr:S8 family serine peptidase [Tahibacter soli]MDC8015103.1 S8 family serine peptidase [Tahibacter soli]